MKYTLAVNGNSIPIDKEGFLKNLSDWDEPVAAALAAEEGIKLGAPHWEVLWMLKKHYEHHRVSPANRAFVSLTKKKLGPDKGKSVYLMSLFGGSPAKLASKIAGLPKPDNCL